MNSLLPLGEAFGFTSHDLQANRKKQLSGAQYRRLAGQWLMLAMGGLLLTLAPLVVTWGLISWSTDQTWGQTFTDSRALIGYVVGLLLGFFYALINLPALLVILDLLRGRVQSIKGTAKVQGSYLVVDTKYRFLLGETALQSLQNGLTYRVFVLPASQTLLSIEFAE